MGRRIRAVKPEFWENEDVQSLDRDVRYTLIGLWMYVDDHGRGSANPSLIRSAVYPLDDMSADVIEGHLTQLDDAGLIRIYDVGRRSYIQIVDWRYWQRVDKAADSRLPPPPDSEPADSSPREDDENILDDLAGEGRGGERRERGARERELGGDEWGDESEPRGGGQGVAANPLPGLPPAPWCPEHEGGTDDPCRPCGTARRRHDYWIRTHE